MLLQYQGSGVYKTSLASGDIEITPDEIYTLLREIAKQEPIPSEIFDFEYNKCWINMAPKNMASIKHIIENIAEADFKDLVDAEIDEIVDKTIVEAQTVANEYYKQNYILVERY